MTQLEKVKIVMKYSDKILELVDNHDMPRGDVQGIAEAIVMNILNDKTA